MTPTPQEQSPQQALAAYLEPYGNAVTFRRNSVVYMPGQPAQTLYLVRSGQISLQLLSSSGQALTLQVVEAGQMFGYCALTGDEGYDTFAEVIRPVQAVALSRERVLDAMHDHPPVGVLLLEALGRYRLRVSRRLDEVAFKSVSARLASLLLDMADAASEGQLQLRLPRRTHQQLADMINSYRETVTKVINQFRAANLLDIDQTGITLLNLSRLRELAQG
jgi:CRP-like cAMP-binding protein